MAYLFVMFSISIVLNLRNLKDTFFKIKDIKILYVSDRYKWNMFKTKFISSAFTVLKKYASNNRLFSLTFIRK